MENNKRGAAVATPNKKKSGAKVAKKFDITKKILGDLLNIHEYLTKHEATRSELAEVTGVDIHPICWHVDTLKKLGKVKVIRKGIDPISERTVEYLSAVAVEPANAKKVVISINVKEA